jgi:hypothetical protein
LEEIEKEIVGTAMGLLAVESYPMTEDFLTAVDAQFAQGAKVVQVTRDHRIIQTIFEPEASKEMLALSVARHWVEDPSVFRDLTDRLGEEPLGWD